MALHHELHDAWRTEPRDHQLAIVWIIVLGLALRLMYLNQPMRYDESITYMYFVRLPWSEALSTYTYPNNHLFHTLLTKLSVAVFGDAPWALRLPAFAAGTFSIPASYAAARVLYGARAALFTAAVVASSGVLILYSTNARGYSIVVLAFLLLVLIAARSSPSGSSTSPSPSPSPSPSLVGWSAFAVIAALGLWTIPVMLFPLGSIAVWFALSALVDGRPRDMRGLAISLAGTAVLTSLAYAPVIRREGLAAIIRNRFVAPSDWFDFFVELPRTIAQAVQSWGLGVPMLSVVLIVFAATALVRHATASRFRVGLPLAAFVWCAWLLVVTHRAPFPRVWLWLLPLVAALASVGLLRVLEQWPRTQQLLHARSGIVAVALAFLLATPVVVSFAVLLSRDTGTFRDAKEAAEVLSGVITPGDVVLAGIPTNGPLDYYLHQENVDRAHLTMDPISAVRVFVIVDLAEGQSLEQMTAGNALGDTTRFGRPRVIATLAASRIYMYEPVAPTVAPAANSPPERR